MIQKHKPLANTLLLSKEGYVECIEGKIGERITFFSRVVLELDVVLDDYILDQLGQLVDLVSAKIDRPWEG